MSRGRAKPATTTSSSDSGMDKNVGSGHGSDSDVGQIKRGQIRGGVRGASNVGRGPGRSKGDSEPLSHAFSDASTVDSAGRGRGRGAKVFNRGAKNYVEHNQQLEANAKVGYKPVRSDIHLESSSDSSSVNSRG